MTGCIVHGRAPDEMPCPECAAMTRDETPRDPLREAVHDLHRWDVMQGWGKFNTILGRMDDALASSTQDALDVEALAEAEHTTGRCGVGAIEGPHAVADCPNVHVFRRSAGAIATEYAAILAARGQQ